MKNKLAVFQVKPKSEDIFSKVKIIIKKILAKSSLNVKGIGCDATCSLGKCSL